MTATTNAATRRWRVWAMWLPGLLVALGAGVATAHGAFEVAVAADVPAAIAWLYPLITDGLALVAYVSTARLTGSGRRYAWTVVVLCAGLSGIAQAAYLAGGVAAASVPLRFGVGAWPAIAAAIVAHLLFLLGHEVRAATSSFATDSVEPMDVQDSVQPRAFNSAVRPTVQPAAEREPEPYKALPRREAVQPTPDPTPTASAGRPPSGGGGGAKDRARSAARRHASLHGSLPTATELEKLAQVSRGTAGAALKELREQPAHLHIVNDSDKEISHQ